MRTALARHALLAAAVAAPLLAGCSRTLPGGFWLDYRPRSITAHDSLLEPRRGWLWVQWEAEAGGTFSESAAMHYAQEAGWRFANRRELVQGEAEDWRRSGEAIFPLRWPDLESAPVEAAVAWLPRHVEPPLGLSTFDSGWMLESEGTSAMQPAPGYVLVSGDGRRMAVYHLWGRW